MAFGIDHPGSAARHVKDGAPVPAHEPAGAPGDPRLDLPVEALPLRRLHREVAGEGVQERNVLACRVRRLPDVAPDPDVLEETAGLDLRRVVGHLLGWGRRPASLVALSDRVVDVLDLGEEGIEAGGEGVERAPESKVAAGAE